MSYIYLLPLGDKSAFKIGKANAPQRRITQLTYFYSVDVNGVMIISCWNEDLAFKLESFLHILFHRYSTVLEGDGGTEFFEYTAYPIAKQICENIGQIKGYCLIPFVVDSTVVAPTPAEVVLTKISQMVQSKRLSMNLTQQEVADMAKVSKRTVQRLEKNQQANLSHVVQILIVLGLHGKLLNSINLPLRQRAKKFVFVGDNDHEPEKSGVQEI